MDVRKSSTQMAAANKHRRPTRQQLRGLARRTVEEQFKATLEAARGCNLVVVGGVLQTAAHSIAEALRIPYVYAAYCPAALRSPEHPPARIRPRIRSQRLPAMINRWLWMMDERRWNSFFGDAVNKERAALGLKPVGNVARYVSTDEPWLAADPCLGPAPSTTSLRVTQTGAWLLSDPAALPESVEKFLAEGEPPVYFGFGSMMAAPQAGPVLIESARAQGRRAILSQGWANLGLSDTGTDWLSIGDVNHEKLFERVAAVVHHGGAGTTAAAARAGKPQVIIPHNYDQYYWAHRVKKLGIGASGPVAQRLNLQSVAAALRECLRPEVGAAAQAFASRVELRGARIAAERLMREFA
jgi:vancomycin aglycone glucosyltransferase